MELIETYGSIHIWHIKPNNYQAICHKCSWHKAETSISKIKQAVKKHYQSHRQETTNNNPHHSIYADIVKREYRMLQKAIEEILPKCTKCNTVHCCADAVTNETVLVGCSCEWTGIGPKEWIKKHETHLV
jgi:aspartate/glutamate racemase